MTRAEERLSEAMVPAHEAELSSDHVALLFDIEGR